MSPWIDTLPAIPLAQGVPVVNPASGQRGVVFDGTVVCISLTECRLCRIALAPLKVKQAWATADPNWRVDLADPQGFGYALRWLRETHRTQDEWLDGPDEWWCLVENWSRGETTDADRLDIAKALKEVARG